MTPDERLIVEVRRLVAFGFRTPARLAVALSACDTHEDLETLTKDLYAFRGDDSRVQQAMGWVQKSLPCGTGPRGSLTHVSAANEFPR
jgi:hypothetical protein